MSHQKRKPQTTPCKYGSNIKSDHRYSNMQLLLWSKGLCSEYVRHVVILSHILTKQCNWGGKTHTLTNVQGHSKVR
jgi:hypothetical protein